MSEGKVYRIFIAPTVNDKMFEHFEFLARVSVPAANKLLDGMLNDIRSLEKMPYRNASYNRPYLPSGKYRYIISSKRYHIIYQIDGDFVFVDDIQDSRQGDEKSILYPS